VIAALTADPAYRDGWFWEVPTRGLRAMARIYAGWALSQRFYRERMWTALGHRSLEDFLVAGWEGNFRRRDANDLLAQLRTWQACDVSDNPAFARDLPRALGAIRARTLVMPSTTDLYFRVADNALEVRHIADAELRPIDSPWGHQRRQPDREPGRRALHPRRHPRRRQVHADARPAVHHAHGRHLSRGWIPQLRVAPVAPVQNFERRSLRVQARVDRHVRPARFGAVRVEAHHHLLAEQDARPRQQLPAPGKANGRPRNEVSRRYCRPRRSAMPTTSPRFRTRAIAAIRR
jgi:hypothetical protein